MFRIRKIESIEQIEQAERTKITSFFELNCQDEFAQTLLYRQIPEHYTWNSRQRKWKRRKKVLGEDPMPETIGRLYSIHPTQIELYALRLLLNHVKGPKSYQDIRTVKRVVYESFKDAAIALGLVKNDYIWIECMKEHHDWQTNIDLIHQLFATIIAKCEVNKHKMFYKTCKNYLHIDFLHTYKVEFPKNPCLLKYIANNATIESDDEVSLLDEDVVEDNMIVLETYEDDDEWTLEKFASNSSLCDLEQILAKEDLSLKDFDLPVPNMEKEEFIQNHL